MNEKSGEILRRLDAIVLGKGRTTRLALVCLLAGGHLLLEDVPGVGKTTLALALARVLGLQFQRIQFTSDLLPTDVLGVSVFEREQSSFRFHPGPVFTQLLLADEINRASPKTQSALLEAMEERQVTTDGETRPLPRPFFVVATQNPLEQVGTFPLPESQWDRFLMRLSIGYPGESAERELLAGRDRRELLAETSALLDADSVLRMQDAVRSVGTTPPLLDYILALVHSSRRYSTIGHGLSPRAGLALRAAAQAWALIEGRAGVIPEDVQAVFPAVAAHRLVAVDQDRAGASVAEELLASVAIP